MIFSTGSRLRRSEEDSYEDLARLAEDFTRRRKAAGKKPGPGGKRPQTKRLSEKGSVGRARDSARSRPLAPRPGESNGVSGSGRLPEAQPPELIQDGQSSASPELSVPQLLSSQHWDNGIISSQQFYPIQKEGSNKAPPLVFNPQFTTSTGGSSTADDDPFTGNWNDVIPSCQQLYSIPEDSPNAAPPPVCHPQTITPTGRTPTDNDTDWMDLDFLIPGGRRTFHGLYTRLEHHSTVSPRLARLSKHGIQPRPPAAGLGNQAIMTLCIPVCIPNVWRGCREKDVVMEVDEFLGNADFCVGVGIVEKIKAAQAGLDLNVGSGAMSLPTNELTPVVGMNTPAPTSSYNGHRDTIHAHGMEQMAHPPQLSQPIVSPNLGHEYTLFPGPNGGSGAAFPGEPCAQPPQVPVPAGWATPYVFTSAPNDLDPVYGVGTGGAEYFFQGEDFDFLAWEPLEGCEFDENPPRN